VNGPKLTHLHPSQPPVRILVVDDDAGESAVSVEMLRDIDAAEILVAQSGGRNHCR